MGDKLRKVSDYFTLFLLYALHKICNFLTNNMKNDSTGNVVSEILKNARNLFDALALY